MPYPTSRDYTQKIVAKEVVRVDLKRGKPGTPADLFTISFAPKGKGADLTLAWGNEAWSIDVSPRSDPRRRSRRGSS